MVLELGGNDPIIVMEDADIEEAATLAAGGSYKNSGQRCTAVKRMLVHQDVADRFVAFDMLTAVAVAFSALTAVATGRSGFLDVALVLSLVNFVATAAFALFLERKGRG